MVSSNYSDLVHEIRQKDRRFRFFQGLFVSIILIGLLGIGLLCLKQIAFLNEQAQVRTKNLNLLIEDNKRQTEYIKCIARFFNERNRTGATITNLDQCTIQKADGTISPPDNVPPDTSTVSSTQFIPMAQTESQPTVSVEQPANNPTITVPDNPVTPPATNPSHDPVRVLGVPVCVPLTNVCVRR